MASATERNITTRLPTNDLFKTSTGVGHHWRPGYYFPDSKFHASLRDPLPPLLVKSPEILPQDHFKTTSGTFHDDKYPFGPLQQAPLFKRAPGHDKVHYLKDFIENIPNRGWRRPLSPSHQLSETHDEFRTRPKIFEPNPWLNVQNFNLYDHHTDGPSKKIVASTENPKLKGRIIYPKDQEVLRLLDPYMTTNLQYHRTFDPKELNGIAKKDVPTYWDCEEYPKVRGYGLKHNPVPKSAIPRENPPMRDTTVFKLATSIRRLPSSGDIVPHSGMLTEYDDKYTKPSDVKSKEAHLSPVDCPCPIPDPNPKSKYDVPKMYETEYTNYGSEYPAVV